VNDDEDFLDDVIERHRGDAMVGGIAPHEAEIGFVDLAKAELSLVCLVLGCSINADTVRALGALWLCGQARHLLGAIVGANVRAST
jgi:hypothetical protein